jgi:hypothetical protein
MNKNLVVLLFFCFSLLNSSELKPVVVQKLTKINFSQQEIEQVLQQIEFLQKNSIPDSVIVKLINEAEIKKVKFQKFYPALKTFVSLSISAKEFIEKVSSEKFKPKDYEYCITTVIQLLDSNVSEEEFIRFMSLLSTKYTFDDAVAMMNYYSVLKKYFSKLVIDQKNNKIVAPYEILFLKYYVRPVKEMSVIVQNITKLLLTYPDSSSEVYNLLIANSSSPTNKIIKQLQNFYDRKVKQEVKKEIEQETKYLQKRLY